MTRTDRETCACDLCGSDDYHALPSFITRPHTVVICRDCGLVYTNPRQTAAALEAWLRDGFVSDPGAQATGAKDVTAEKLHKRVQKLRPYVEDLVKRFGDVQGKKWLEVRSRSGPVLEIVAEMGAEVHGVDPFEANIAFARNHFSSEQFYTRSMNDLLGTIPGKFDFIGMLTIHVPSHSPSPTKLLRDCYERLNPGGLVLVSEKDITRPRPYGKHFSLSGDSAIAHFQHMTLGSTRAFVEKAGFKIMYANHVDRWSSVQHLLVVGQKPATPNPARAIRADDPDALFSTLVRLYLRHRLEAPLRFAKAYSHGPLRDLASYYRRSRKKFLKRRRK